MSRPRVRVPETAAAGEVILIRALISHPMESGQRRDTTGAVIPRKIINSFSCTFNGRPVFSCDMAPAIAANPYFEFHAKVEEAGIFFFTWVDDDGSVHTDEKPIALA